MNKPLTYIIALLAMVALAVPAMGLTLYNDTERHNDTERGSQPDVSPQVVIESPTADGASNLGATTSLRAGEPLVVRVAFSDLAYRPDARTPGAADSLATEPQVVVDGRVQGHIHLYAIPIGADSNRASPFCIFELEHLVESEGYNGVAERECGSLTPGEWRVIVDVNTDSHDSVYKAHPQEVPASDAVRVLVPER